MPENDIGQDRFQARLTKELRIKGSMPAPVLAPEIVPVLIIEGERVENLHLQREHRFSCTLALGGVVNEYYYFQLWNPAGRTGLVIVDEFSVASTAATVSWDWGYADAAVTGSLGPRDSFCMDSRIPGRAPRQGVAEPMCGTDLGGGLIEIFGRSRSLPGRMDRIVPGVVVTPGHGFSIQCGALNENVNGYCFWREREAEVGELI